MITPERFWKKVDKSGDCWEWKAARNTKGYGVFGVVSGKVVLAHRYMWELVNGPIPPGMCVLHRCDNPGCCNPEHLFTGTHADNMADMATKGRHGCHTKPESFLVRASGEASGRSKLTEPQVREIRALYGGGGVRMRDLGQHFGVSESQISNVVRGKNWKGCVTGPTT